MAISARQTMRLFFSLSIAIVLGVFLFPDQTLSQAIGSVAEPTASISQPVGSSAKQSAAPGQTSPDLGQPMVLGPGIFWLGVLLGYFLVYTINVGSRATDALKSFLGVLGIGGGGLLAVLPTSSNSLEVAAKLADETAKLATSLQDFATKSKQSVQIDPDLFNRLSGILASAAHDSIAYQRQLTGAQMQFLSSYARGAMWGFVIYAILAIVLSGLYSRYYLAPAANEVAHQAGLALFAQTLAKTLLGEDFGSSPNDPVSQNVRTA
jgi:hypothetical protein